jgi:hypothetical protein
MIIISFITIILLHIGNCGCMHSSHFCAHATAAQRPHTLSHSLLHSALTSTHYCTAHSRTLSLTSSHYCTAHSFPSSRMLVTLDRQQHAAKLVTSASASAAVAPSGLQGIVRVAIDCQGFPATVRAPIQTVTVIEAVLYCQVSHRLSGYPVRLLYQGFLQTVRVPRDCQGFLQTVRVP